MINYFRTLLLRLKYRWKKLISTTVSLQPFSWLVFLHLAVTSVLEGMYPWPSELSPCDQLLCLAGQPIFPVSSALMKWMKLSHDALNTLSQEHVQLAVQLYHIIHALQDGVQLFKTTWNQLQHPQPSTVVALLALIDLDGQLPFDFDCSMANCLIEQEAMKDTGDYQSSLFGNADDPAMAEFLEYM